MICVFKKLFMYVSETRSKTILYNCKIYCISLIHLFKHKTNPKNRQPHHTSAHLLNNISNDCISCNIKLNIPQNKYLVLYTNSNSYKYNYIPPWTSLPHIKSPSVYVPTTKDTINQDR